LYLFLIKLIGKVEILSPYQKPVELWVHLLTALLPNRTAGCKIPLVLDLTSGLGSISIACIQCGLHSAAIQSDPLQHGYATRYAKSLLSQTKGAIHPFNYDEQTGDPEPSKTILTVSSHHNSILDACGLLFESQ
jgi:hypothetical protein